MFVNNIDPVFIKIFGLEIRYYGVIYAFGFLFTVWFLLYLSKKEKLPLTKDEVFDFSLYLIIGTLLGARLFEVLFYQPAYYFSNPLQIFAYWNGGLSFHGGLFGASFCSYLFLKKHNKNPNNNKRKIEFYDLADAVAIPLSLGLALGRIANFINGELYGKVTTVVWAVKFNSAEGFRHPTQLYESAKNFFILGTLYFKSKNHYKKGYLFWLFVTMYGALRFMIEFLKVPESTFLGMPIGQMFSLWMFIIGAYILVTQYAKPK